MGAPPRASRRLRRLLRAGWLVLTVVALGVASWQRRAAVAEAVAQLGPASFAAASAAALAGVGVSALVWRRGLAGYGTSLPRLAAGRVFFLSQLGKYLPGAVWPVLAQAELGRDLGVPRRVSGSAAVTFLWVHLVTGTSVAGAALAASGVLPPAVVVLAAALLVLLHPRLLAGSLDTALRAARRDPLPARPDRRDVLAAAGWALLMWACYGAHLAALARGLGTPLPSMSAVGTFAAAWVGGFVVAFAPAGAGAREAVLVALLLPTTDGGAALAVALLSRALVTLADVAWAGASLVASSAGGGAVSAGSPRRSSTAAVSRRHGRQPPG